MWDFGKLRGFGLLGFCICSVGFRVLVMGFREGNLGFIAVNWAEDWRLRLLVLTRIAKGHEVDVIG